AEPNLAAVPDGLRPLVEQCMAKDPARRPTAANVLRWLTQATSDDEEIPWLPESALNMLAGRRNEFRTRPDVASARPTPRGPGPSTAGPSPAPAPPTGAPAGHSVMVIDAHRAVAPAGVSLSRLLDDTSGTVQRTAKLSFSPMRAWSLFLV